MVQKRRERGVRKRRRHPLPLGGRETVEQSPAAVFRLKKSYQLVARSQFVLEARLLNGSVIKHGSKVFHTRVAEH
eukprot:CAMPEP_0114155114 /NCGR_PEP_ID=MMETSP0043_2-20121206/25294_1 /TAXON_ID=464988 /ORGANISM="Hemiselmis andersenii, Strain CCMP644" /LENGTH=74 /DNA_ID=CAMNT_0001250351 /DNA_START=74 /DNA_END=295 /DNA_ORIENTATION=-